MWHLGELSLSQQQLHFIMRLYPLQSVVKCFVFGHKHDTTRFIESFKAAMFFFLFCFQQNTPATHCTLLALYPTADKHSYRVAGEHSGAL